MDISPWRVCRIETQKGGPVWELWTGARPHVAINSYLRAHYLAWSPRTREGEARRLIHLARWADEVEVDFWCDDLRLAGHTAAEFRNDLALRVALNDSDSISHAWAAKILESVFRLCRWWRQKDEPELGHRRLAKRRGAFSHLDKIIVKRPATLMLPKSHAPVQNDVLHPEELDAIWAFWDRREPPMPSLLRQTPRRAWPKHRRAQWNASYDRYHMQLAWWARNTALLGIFVGAAPRRAEVGLLTTEDVFYEAGELWARFIEREETREYGDIKTIEKEVRVSWDSRVVRVVTRWLELRQHLLRAWTERGNEPHDMLFTTRNGGPYRPVVGGGRDQWFLTVRKQMGPFGRATLRPFNLHAHVFRHTLTAVWRSWGLDEATIAKQLGHQSMETTSKYGQVLDPKYNQQLDLLQRHLAGTAT